MADYIVALSLAPQDVITAELIHAASDVQFVDVPTSIPIEEHKRIQLEKQDAEREYINHVSEQKRKHYKNMFGKDYDKLKVFDYIEDTEITIKDYISQDKDNIVFYIKPETKTGVAVTFATNRSALADKMTIYDVDYQEKEDEPKKYLSMNLLVYPGAGVMSYDGVKRAVLRSNYQIFAIKREALQVS